MILHCFSMPQRLDECLDHGWFISYAGNVTYPKSQALAATAMRVPLERLLVETDCPYLAPVPYRGRRCEPAMLPKVLEKLAEIRGWSLKEAEARTEDAFFAVFDRIPRP